MTSGREISDSTFLLTANGASNEPPAAPVVEYFLRNGAKRVSTIFHPLGAEERGRHELTTYGPDGRAVRREVPLPSRPPYTYPLDMLVPPVLPAVDVCIAFNNLLCSQALAARRIGRIDKVAYWAVDFVPNRFGPGPLTAAYDLSDRYCCRAADVRVEVSRAALEARNERHGLSAREAAPAIVAPIGAWLDRTLQIPDDAWERRRIVFIGHFVERMGVDTVIEGLAALAARGVDFTADIIGHGPLDRDLRELNARRGLSDRVIFRGYISDHHELERVVAGGSIALAPYSTRVESFTRFADPSKLKTYLAAGLPILLTDVPPNASELEAEGGAEVVADDPESFATAIEHLLADRDEWRRRREAALRHATRFDWSTIIAPIAEALGLRAPAPPRAASEQPALQSN